MPKSKTDFTNFVDARPNYFPGQFLLEDDFEVEQKYLIDRQKYHRQSLHVSGLVEGLEVEVIENKPEVQIKSGSAINSNGDLIILKKDTFFSQFATLTTGELYIIYKEEKQVKQQEEFTRWEEVPTIGFAATTPNEGVKLAKISIVKDVLTLDLTVRSYSGIFLPNATGNDLTLRSGGNANPNVAILNGSLTVAGTITGNIDATNIKSGVLAVARIPDLSANKITSGTISGSLTFTNVLKIGEDAGGTRDWMTRGISILWDSDNLFIGLKDEGLNRKDAVIAWGDNPQDDLRFIHVPSEGAKNDTEIMRLKPSGNVGIGTTTPSEKLEVSGNLKVTGTITGKIDATNINSGQLNIDRILNLPANKITSGQLHIDRIPDLPANKITAGTTTGNLTIGGNLRVTGSLTADNKITVPGNQKIEFTDADVTNNLKLQLWSGYGLGINSSTLFYAANGTHSWRDNNGNERMMLTTGAAGSLTVSGTGTSSFTGNLRVSGAITPSAGNSERNGIMFPKNPGGGGGDAAWIRYWARLNEATTFEIGTSDNEDDHIALMPGAGNVGIGTTTPSAKLEVNGTLMNKMDLIDTNKRSDWHSSNHPIKIYFRDRLAGKPVGTWIRAIQNHSIWRGHYWDGWVDADGAIRVIHNHNNTAATTTNNSGAG